MGSTAFTKRMSNGIIWTLKLTYGYRGVLSDLATWLALRFGDSAGAL